MQWAPSFKTIRKFYNQFNNDGSVLERKCYPPSSVHSLEIIDAVRMALQEAPVNKQRKLQHS
jgi:hypothetical protein